MRRSSWFTAVVIGAALIASPALANVTHIVAFKYKVGVTAAQRDDFARRFIALKDDARRNGRPYILSITSGREISREGFDGGVEQVFVVTFKSTDDRDYFVGKPYREAPDPAHGALMPVVMSMVDQDATGKPAILVLDFEAPGAQ